MIYYPDHETLTSLWAEVQATDARAVRCGCYDDAHQTMLMLNRQQPGQWFVHESSFAVLRWQVSKLPQRGDEVSRGFNGDYYPAGKIVSISATGDKIVTSDGTVFRRARRGNINSWRETGGCFNMVRGHHDERNPHF